MRLSSFKRFNSFAVTSALLLLFALAPSAHAVNPANVDIHVSISNSKDLTVSSTYYNFGALAVNTSSVSTSITVTNPSSTGLVETFTIKGDTATADAGGVDWVLANSTGTDQYALGAQFSNTRPTDVDGSWTSDDLNSTSAVTATSTVLGNGTAGESGAGVLPGQNRLLWLRLKTPSVVTDPGHHKAAITLSVL